MDENNSTIEFLKVLLKSVGKLLGPEIQDTLPFDASSDVVSEAIEYVSSINISGQLSGDLYLYASKESLKEILNIVYSMDFDTLVNDGLLNDSVNEFLNLVIARSTETLSQAGMPIHVGVPMERMKAASVHYLESSKNCLKITVKGNAFYIVFVSWY